MRAETIVSLIWTPAALMCLVTVCACGRHVVNNEEICQYVVSKVPIINIHTQLFFEVYQISFPTKALGLLDIKTYLLYRLC